MINTKETSGIAFYALDLKRTLHTCAAQENRGWTIWELEAPPQKNDVLFLII